MISAGVVWNQIPGKEDKEDDEGVLQIKLDCRRCLTRNQTNDGESLMQRNGRSKKCSSRQLSWTLIVTRRIAAVLLLFLLMVVSLSSKAVTTVLTTSILHSWSFVTFIRNRLLVQNQKHQLRTTWPKSLTRNPKKKKKIVSSAPMIPTLLSIIDPETNHYVHALDNELYNRIQNIITRQRQNQQHYKNYGAEENDYNPKLLLSKTKLSTNDNSNKNDLILSWMDGQDEFGNVTVTVQNDDLIFLYCGNYDNDDNIPFDHNNDDDDVLQNTATTFTLLEIATIAQIQATTRKQQQQQQQKQQQQQNHHTLSSLFNDSTWYIPDFPKLRYDACQFSLHRLQQQQQLQLLATSPIIDMDLGRYRPSQIHLALSTHQDQMVVNFVTGDITATTTTTTMKPVVKYGMKQQYHFNQRRQVLVGTSTTYTADSMCQAPANLTEPGKFVSPGQLHTVVLRDLLPNTEYQYQVGIIVVVSDKDDDDEEESMHSYWNPEIFSFTSPPPIPQRNNFTTTTTTTTATTFQPFSYLVYGDQGSPSNDYFARGSKLVIPNIEKEVRSRQNDDATAKIRAIHHIGDLSYAVGAAHHWDAWFNAIQPFASRVPLMIAVGNHEYDYRSGGGGDNGKDPSAAAGDNDDDDDDYSGFHPDWGDFGNDSGGECGVPTSKRFTMPHRADSVSGSSGSNGVFWYSYDFANVHTTVLSSEHDLSIGSRQYKWLEQDLKSIDRVATPWVVVELHRPLYESEMYWNSNQDGIAMRYEFEDLLHDYQVDLVLAGHYHAYHRTCDNLYRSKCYATPSSNSNITTATIAGPTHITIGTAGANLDDIDLYENNWTAKNIQGVYGFGRITVMNATALHFEFVNAGDDDSAGQVLDDVWIWRDRV